MCLKGCQCVSRSYVAIYQNKKLNYFLYFDFKKHEFFSIAERKSQSMILLTSFASIVFYAVMKNVSFGIGINPLNILFIAGVLGIMLGYISIKLTNRAIEKGLERIKEVIHTTNRYIREYIIEGKKQYNVQGLVILLLFFFMFLS